MKQENTEMTRNVSMDLLRIISCFFIILLHASGQLDLTSKLWKTIQVIVRPALWTFMALTGYFIFRKPIDNYLKFWFKHITGLIIPVTIYLLFQHIVINKTITGFDPLIFFKGDPIGHLWFVYKLIQIYILVPFLKQMLEAMNKKQLIVLLSTFLIISRIIEILRNNGISVGFSINLIEEDSLFFVILGYYLYKYPIKFGKDYYVYLLMFINFIFTYYGLSSPILVVGVCEFSFVMAIGVICYISIFDKLDKKINIDKNLGKTISFIGKRTFGIYIIHMMIFQYMIQQSIMLLEGESIIQIAITLLVKCIVIFANGLLVSILLDSTIVYIVKWIFNKVYEILENILNKIKIKIKPYIY